MTLLREARGRTQPGTAKTTRFHMTRFPAKRLLALLLLLAPAPASALSGPVVGANGMVVSAQRLASQVGADVLQHGGNAVDAAVAVGYALAVVYPAAGNLGGGGFMTIRFPDGRATFLDFREKAPLAATETMFQDAQGNVVKGRSTESWLAVGVPGSVAGLEAAHDALRQAAARGADRARYRARP